MTDVTEAQAGAYAVKRKNLDEIYHCLRMTEEKDSLAGLSLFCVPPIVAGLVVYEAVKLLHPTAPELAAVAGVFSGALLYISFRLYRKRRPEKNWLHVADDLLAAYEPVDREALIQLQVDLAKGHRDEVILVFDWCKHEARALERFRNGDFRQFKQRRLESQSPGSDEQASIDK